MLATTADKRREAGQHAVNRGGGWRQLKGGSPYVECKGCGVTFTPTHGNVRYHSAACKRASRRQAAHTLTCAWCGTTFEVAGGWAARARYCTNRCEHKARLERDKHDPKRKAKSIHQTNRRRLAKRDTDLTATDVARLIAKAKRCPLCSVPLRGRHPQPSAPHLDHIVPLNAGGTHTYANVRVICALCNQKRPKDGSDYHGQIGLGSIR